MCCNLYPLCNMSWLILMRRMLQKSFHFSWTMLYNVNPCNGKVRQIILLMVIWHQYFIVASYGFKVTLSSLEVWRADSFPKVCKIFKYDFVFQFYFIFLLYLQFNSRKPGACRGGGTSASMWRLLTLVELYLHENDISSQETKPNAL